MKKLIAFIFAALFAVVSFAATETVNGVKYTYSIANGEATIGYGRSVAIPQSTSGNLVIPSKLGGYPVTTIESLAFYRCSSLTSVTIPNGVTTIGEWAFAYCSSLTSVTIPDSVTTIGDIAFEGTVNLNAIIVADANPSYRTIDGILYTKDGLTLVACPGAKRSVTIPESVTTIGECAFYYCSSLTSITIPDSVTSIGNHAFYDCSSLKEVYITDLAKWCAISFADDCANPCYYSHHLYLKDEDIVDLVIPDGVTTIGDYAFYNCSSLASVTIPEGVTTIEKGAFEGCRSLTSVTIPSSVTTIGDYAFRSCSMLKSVTIPEGVTSIGGCVFWGCDSLTSVTIPESVTTIGECAFYYCSSLTSITIPDSVTSIGNGAFEYCSSLTSVTIPSSVTTIGIEAFSNCTSLTSVTIPSSVTTIGEGAFDRCSSLATVYADSGDTERVRELMRGKGIDVDNLTFVETAYKLKIDENGCLTGYEGELPSELVVPEGVKAIGQEAFKDCTTITSIKIPNSVTSIGKRTFYGCENLESVVLPANKPNIGSQAFFGVPWYENAVVDYASGASQTVANSVTVTNVVVHYVVNSVKPEFAKPVSEDTGFVNVIAEVKGTSVAVPQTWAEEYPEFTAKFGSDFTKALTAKSGKTAAGGREMLVWEDYVAGTDPTNPESKFTATMTMVNGKPVISWTPELDSERAALRKYTTYGKAKLTDSEWTVVEEGREDDYNFFKVTVEMR